jgi:hypothetical protein
MKKQIQTSEAHASADVKVMDRTIGTIAEEDLDAVPIMLRPEERFVLNYCLVKVEPVNPFSLRELFNKAKQSPKQRLPSYNKIRYILNSLTENGFLACRSGEGTHARTWWSVNPAFYSKWLKRRREITVECETRQKEFAINFDTGTFDIYGLYPKVVLEFYNISLK